MKIADLVKNCTRIGISGHEHPDGDCAGACCGLALYLRKILPEAQVDVFLEPLPDALRRNIPGAETIRTEVPVGGAQYDAFIVLDSMPDIHAMERAAALLTGMHDFRSFCGNSRMKKSSIRVVDVIRIEESGNYIRFYYHGNGFLQNMVRIMTGTLLEVGMGKREPGDMEEIIEARDRRKAGYTAPAQGLCLMKVDY